jgi:hypothetical protein
MHTTITFTIARHANEARMAANRQYIRLPLAATTKTTSNKKQNGYKEKKNKNKQCELDAYSI